jgi:hypothetical protein
MYQQAKKEVTALHHQRVVDPHHELEDDGGHFPSRLQKDLQTLRVRQLKSQTLRSSPINTAADANLGKSSLFQGTSDSSVPSPTDVVMGQQEVHLEAMSRHLGELGSLATNLNESMSRQSDTLETLDGKSDSMLFKSKMVTRRADRLLQKKVRYVRSNTNYPIRTFAVSFTSHHLTIIYSNSNGNSCSRGPRPRQSLCTMPPSDMSRLASTCRSRPTTIMPSSSLPNTTRRVFSVSGNERERRCLVSKTTIPDAGRDRICWGIWRARQNPLTGGKSGMYVATAPPQCGYDRTCDWMSTQVSLTRFLLYMNISFYMCIGGRRRLVCNGYSLYFGWLGQWRLSPCTTRRWNNLHRRRRSTRQENRRCVVHSGACAITKGACVTNSV